MINIWDLLVVDVFGGFWLAVLGMCFIFFVIMMFGGVSIFDNFIFNLMFFFAMALGYGYAFVTVPISILIVSWFVSQWMQWIERGGYG